MALAVNDSRDLNSEFSAKAHAPNHQKITGALVYNAEHSGATTVASGGRRPRTDAPC